MSRGYAVAALLPLLLDALFFFLSLDRSDARQVPPVYA